MPEDRHPKSQRFVEILNELIELHDQKQKDYGTDQDPFKNVRSAEAFGLKAWEGVAIRMNDKMVRIQSHMKKGYTVNDSLEDDFRDLAVYAGIALVLLEEEADDE